MGLARQRGWMNCGAALIALSNSCVKTANFADRISRSLSALDARHPDQLRRLRGLPDAGSGQPDRGTPQPRPVLRPSGAPSCQGSSREPAAPPAELDPNESNPRLFAMAPEASDQVAQGSAADLLGGEMEATKERMTPSGLKITDLVEGTALKPKAATPSR